MNISYFLFWLWNQLVDHVLPLAGYLLLAIMVPRVGRLMLRVIESRLDEQEEATKARLALVGALVYVFQAVAYFLLIIVALSNVGVPALGAAIPATVVSAAVGFGAQKIIGDFLAGFFILSEKQFGVGDYVSFDGVTGVEGTVVALTLRTTKVRTPTGEVVMVPNGSAGVVTNFSQDWSRAVVDLAVPVQSGESLEEIKTRVDKVSARAVADPAIASDVAGDLEILPATGLIAPTVAGQPWQINFRVLVTVNPARQWAVERGIRSALIAAFWDHYNVSPGLGLPFVSPTTDAARSTAADAANTADAVRTTSADAVDAARNAVATAGGLGAAGMGTEGTETVPVPMAVGTSASAEVAVESKDHGPGRPAESGGGDVARLRRGIWRDDHPQGCWKKMMTAGGRVRQSTMGLCVGLVVVAGLLLFSAHPEDTSAGWLSPAHWTTQAPRPPAQPLPVVPTPTVVENDPLPITQETSTSAVSGEETGSSVPLSSAAASHSAEVSTSVVEPTPAFESTPPAESRENTTPTEVTPGESGAPRPGA